MGRSSLALKTRRTQAQRSASTRGRLLDATIECLLELGYARTTTPEIARRAGLSRGAQLHHFPTKGELVTTAVEHLFERRITEFRRAFATLPADTDRAAAAIDHLWSSFSGPTFYAALELVVAARTDPELRRSVAAVDERFGENVRRTFRDLFPAPARPAPFFEVLPNFIFALMEGLALGRIVYPDDRHRLQILDMLKTLAPLVLPADAR